MSLEKHLCLAISEPESLSRPPLFLWSCHQTGFSKDRLFSKISWFSVTHFVWFKKEGQAWEGWHLWGGVSIWRRWRRMLLSITKQGCRINFELDLRLASSPSWSGKVCIRQAEQAFPMAVCNWGKKKKKFFSFCF